MKHKFMETIYKKKRYPRIELKYRLRTPPDFFYTMWFNVYYKIIIIFHLN